MIDRRFMDANQAQWNERATIHARDETGFYGLDAFRRGGGELYPVEAAELGPVAGKRLAHLQCHIGLDTLMLARRGARVQGLDFSGEAIAFARSLAAETTIPADFIEGDVYAARQLLSGHFDVVYATWGVLIWLPDVRAWAQVVASLLAPGGFLYLADGHPVMNQLDQIDGRLVFQFDRRTDRATPLGFDQDATYTGAGTALQHRRSFEWLHPLSEIVDALLDAGLRLDFLHEHDQLPYRAFPMMVPDAADPRMYRLPPGHPALPLAYSLRASTSA